MDTTFDTEKTEKAKKQAEGALGSLTGDFAKNVKTYSETAIESISDGYETTIAWAKKNPLQAAAVGAGVGFVLGMVIRKYIGRSNHGPAKN